MAKARKQSGNPDPIDLAASAIAHRAVCLLAAEIAAAMRRLSIQPNHLAARHDRTAAERQRRLRAKKAGGA